MNTKGPLDQLREAADQQKSTPPDGLLGSLGQPPKTTIDHLSEVLATLDELFKFSEETKDPNIKRLCGLITVLVARLSKAILSETRNK